MKPFRIAAICFAASFIAVPHADPIDDVVRSFQNQAYYVKPIATLLGSMANTGWYHSAGVGQDFGFYVGLPISLTYIGSGDRSVDSIYVDDGCVQCHTFGGADQGCEERQKLSLPTIFGTGSAPTATASQIDINGNVVWQDNVLFTDGFKSMSQFPLMPFATLQADFSFFYTELKLRYIGVPAGPVIVNLPGFGLQHDLASLMPPLPVSLSVAGNMTIYSVSWAPGKNIDGKLKINGLSVFAGVLGGYKLPFVDFFLEAGWEYSHIKTGGMLTINPTGGGTPEVIRPALSLTGRNMFRAAINVAFPIGYMPVLGGSAGADFGNTINIIGFGH
jgi:hypothetical protein